MSDAPLTEPKADAQRIAKRLARAGVASRREAERMIAAGRVRVNGEILQTPAFLVGDEDRIELDGKPLAAPAPARLWRFHKPPGLVTTAADPEGRATVFDHLPARLPRVMSVGRLDLNSEGLLLLTNDGGLKRALELPSTGWRRLYRVRAFGALDEGRLAALRGGLNMDGERLAPMQIKTAAATGRNHWMEITLTEGRNREIRRALAHVGLTVNRLIRTDYGPFALSDLPRGRVAEIPGFELRKTLKGVFAWPRTRDAHRRR